MYKVCCINYYSNELLTNNTGQALRRDMVLRSVDGSLFHFIIIIPCMLDWSGLGRAVCAIIVATNRSR